MYGVFIGLLARHFLYIDVYIGHCNNDSLLGWCDIICNDPRLTHVDIIRFGPKGALTALKCVYRVKRSPYLYSVRNFPPYPMWDVTNTLPCKHNVLVVSRGITGLNRQTLPMELNKLPHRGQRSTLIPFVTLQTPLQGHDSHFTLQA